MIGNLVQGFGKRKYINLLVQSSITRCTPSLMRNESRPVAQSFLEPAAASLAKEAKNVAGFKGTARGVPYDKGLVSICMVQMGLFRL